MTKEPLLTICILTYNNEKTIKKTLESVLAQTYPNFEILVSDNGSSDATLKIVDSFKDPRISVRKNIGERRVEKWYADGYDNYNGCIKSKAIKGEFVSFYHSDDVYQKDIAKKEVEFLVKNPKAGAVFTMGKPINQQDEIIGTYAVPKELKNKNIYTFEEIFKNVLKYGNTFLLTPTFMTRKNTIEKMGLFIKEKFETSSDLDMWLRILKNYNIGILHESLVHRRVGGSSKSYGSLRTKKADYFVVMDHYLYKEGQIKSVNEKYVRQYNYHKDFDNTLRAMNFLIKGQLQESKILINGSFSWENVRAFFENMTMLKTKVMVLKIILYLGINLRLGKYLGKLLRKMHELKNRG